MRQQQRSAGQLQELIACCCTSHEGLPAIYSLPSLQAGCSQQARLICSERCCTPVSDTQAHLVSAGLDFLPGCTSGCVCSAAEVRLCLCLFLQARPAFDKHAPAVSESAMRRCSSIGCKEQCISTFSTLAHLAGGSGSCLSRCCGSCAEVRAPLGCSSSASAHAAAAACESAVCGSAVRSSALSAFLC